MVRFDCDDAAFDAELKYRAPGLRVADPKACQCGEILKGVKKPWECKVFGTACTPERPIGTCMVSSEGACAAYYNYGRFAREQEIYLQITRRWRNLAKPTIAEVHGKCIAGGLMLAWACDLIVASSDAEFCDPVVTMGVCGVEWFVHPWELGPRKAKELLFTSDVWSAEEAHRLGMVNELHPRDELLDAARRIAEKIASNSPTAVQAVKRAVQLGEGQPTEQAVAIMMDMHWRSAVHPDRIEGIGAFNEGREPTFQDSDY